jgi:hypothetical protein
MTLVTANADSPNQKTTPDNVVTELNAQAKNLATAVAARDVHPLHMIDHATPDEIASAQKAAPNLSTDKKQKFDALCADLAKQASRAHHDGHHNDWNDAKEAQKQFAADTQQIAAILGASS